MSKPLIEGRGLVHGKIYENAAGHIVLGVTGENFRGMYLYPDHYLAAKYILSDLDDYAQWSEISVPLIYTP